MAGNSSQSNIAVDGEVLAGCVIRKVVWGSDGVISLYRGSNALLHLTQSGSIDFAGAGAGLELDSTANISIEVSGSNSFCVVECDKDFLTRANTGY